MKKHIHITYRSINLSVLTATAVLALTVPALAAFDSGSACAVPSDPNCLGAFSPTINTTVTLPPDGILNYTTVNIPAGVTVSFAKNAANTPVVIRASGSVSIAGAINVSAQTAPTASGTAGNGVLGDDGQPGTGGPGGFDGGPGGLGPVLGGTSGNSGGAGKGPGGGQAVSGIIAGAYGYSGGGGGYNGVGGNGYASTSGGLSYGQWSLLPIIGGSGGAGGGSGISFSGSGGGGGGGAILIASSDTISVSGYIYADGGAGGATTGSGSGGAGGSGSGGAIRLVANTLTRSSAGYLYARGAAGTSSDYGGAGAGANGYIRLESNVITNWTTGYSTPAYSYVLPGKLFVPNSPTLTITGVAGQPVPASPTGVGDVTLPQGTATATVQLAGTNIPRGTTVTIYVIPAVGANRSSVLSSALDGASDAATTATATVTLANGNNVLMASATYTVTELIAMNMPKFGGEYVAKIRVESEMGGTASKVTYITASGKEYPANAKAVKAAS